MSFFLALLIKHAFIDLAVQAYLKDIDKKSYFSNAHIHYLQHGTETLVVAIFFLPYDLALLCGLIDYIAHWHIDFGKHRINTAFNIKTRSKSWWWTNAIDAALHFLTYYIIVQIAF